MSFASKNLRFAVAKTESVPGTPEWNLSSTFPADADFKNRLYDIAIAPEFDYDEEVANIATGDHGELSAISGKASAQITFTIPIHWGGAVAVAPNWSNIFAGCGLVETVYTTTGIGWLPLKVGDLSSLTIAVFDVNVDATGDARGYLFSGCKGNAVFSAENTGKLMAKITMKGKFANYIDVAAANIPETTGFQATLAEIMLGTTVVVNSISQYISSISLDLGNDIQPIIDQSENTGYESFYIAARKPRLSMNPLALEQSDDDVNLRLANNSNYPITVDFGNLTLYAPRGQLMPYSIAEREGLISFEQNYILQRNSNGLAAIEALMADEATFELLQGARA